MGNYFRSGDFKRWSAIFLVALALIIAYKVINDFNIVWSAVGSFFTVIQPFVVGMVIAFLLNIPAKYFEGLLLKVKFRFVKARARGFSILLIYLLVAWIINVVLSTALPSFAKHLSELVIVFPSYYESAYDFVIGLNEERLRPLGMDIQSVIESISLDKLVAMINPSYLINSISGLLSVSSFIFNAALSVITSIYFLLEAESIKKFILMVLGTYIPEKTLTMFLKYVADMNIYFNKFIYCQILDAFILGTVVTISLSLMGSKYAAVLGPILGLCNIIPYFGAIIGAIAVIIVVAITDGLGMALTASIILIILQQVDGNVIQPRLLGDSMSLSPLLIIISITIGGAYFGVVGMVIAIPIVAVVKNIILDLVAYKKSKATV